MYARMCARRVHVRVCVCVCGFVCMLWMRELVCPSASEAQRGTAAAALRPLRLCMCVWCRRQDKEANEVIREWRQDQRARRKAAAAAAAEAAAASEDD